MRAVALADLASRTPGDPRRTTERRDPYEMWRGRAQGLWLSPGDMASPADVPGWLRMTETDALDRVLASRNRERVLRTLAVLDLWRTATVEQVEAMADVDGLTRGRTSLVTALWRAGLIDIGRWGYSVGALPEREQIILRPAGDEFATVRLAAKLGWLDWYSMTANLGMDATRQYARHNVLATELGLRMAEHGQIAMALGEKLSAWELLIRPVPGAADLPHGTQSAADLILIRADGLRVLVEMTANVTGIDEKVRRLARLLHERPLVWSGLTACFAIAPRNDKRDTTRSIVTAITRAIELAVKVWPGMAGDPTAAKIGVVTWPAPFPAEGMARLDMGMLPVKVATGPPDARWQQIRMLDPVSLPLHAKDPDGLRAVLQNTAGLRGIPHMLRPGETELPTGGGKVRVRKRQDPTLAKLMLAG